MALSYHNCLTGAARGKIGDVIVKNYTYGQVLTRLPRRSIVPPSEKQLYNQQRWKDAAAYYRRVQAEPALALIYAQSPRKKKERHYPLNALTNRDFFNPPEVGSIDLRDYQGAADHLIVIEAHDDFCVRAVDVILRDAAGNVIEFGPAWEEGMRWHYRTKATAPPRAVTFEVTAQDLPGNRTRATKTWQRAGESLPSAHAPAVAAVVSGPAILDFDPRAG